MSVSLFLSFTDHSTHYHQQLINAPNTAHGKLIIQKCVRTEVWNRRPSVHLAQPVLVEGIFLFFSTESKLACVLRSSPQLHWQKQCNDCWCMTYHQATIVKWITYTTLILNLASPPQSIKHTAFCTRCFLYNWLKHCPVPKLSVQYGAATWWTFTFLRNDIPSGWESQLPKNNKTFLPCTPMEACTAIKICENDHGHPCSFTGDAFHMRLLYFLKTL